MDTWKDRRPGQALLIVWGVGVAVLLVLAFAATGIASPGAGLGMGLLLCTLYVVHGLSVVMGARHLLSARGRSSAWLLLWAVSCAGWLLALGPHGLLTLPVRAVADPLFVSGQVIGVVVLPLLIVLPLARRGHDNTVSIAVR